MEASAALLSSGASAIDDRPEAPPGLLAAQACCSIVVVGRWWIPIIQRRVLLPSCARCPHHQAPFAGALQLARSTTASEPLPAPPPDPSSQEYTTPGVHAHAPPLSAPPPSITNASATYAAGLLLLPLLGAAAETLRSPSAGVAAALAATATALTPRSGDGAGDGPADGGWEPGCGCDAVIWAMLRGETPAAAAAAPRAAPVDRVRAAPNFTPLLCGAGASTRPAFPGGVARASRCYRERGSECSIVVMCRCKQRTLLAAARAIRPPSAHSRQPACKEREEGEHQSDHNSARRGCASRSSACTSVPERTCCCRGIQPKDSRPSRPSRPLAALHRRPRRRRRLELRRERHG